MTELIKYDAACRAISEARVADEAKDIRDRAMAMQTYARQANNKQLEVDAAEIRWKAERRLGELIKAQKETVGLNQGGRPAITPTDSEGVISSPTLEQAGIDYKLSSRAQALAEIPESEFEAEMAQHREEMRVVTMGTMDRLAGRAHVANNSGENEWYTPPEFTDAARRVMGGITLDPASCDKANESVKADTIFTKDDNGMDLPWSGNVWMNPPYSQPLIGQFVGKLIESLGEITQACVLVNNGTETAWGQGLIAECDAVCFPMSRIKFIDQDGKATGAPLQGQMIVYFGRNRDAFGLEFSRFGTVLNGPGRE